MTAKKYVGLLCFFCQGSQPHPQFKYPDEQCGGVAGNGQQPQLLGSSLQVVNSKNIFYEFEGLAFCSYDTFKENIPPRA